MAYTQMPFGYSEKKLLLKKRDREAREKEEEEEEREREKERRRRRERHSIFSSSFRFLSQVHCGKTAVK